MPAAAESCPYCGHEVDVERQDVGDGLLACDYCGELFNRRTPLPADAVEAQDRHDIIGSLYEKAMMASTSPPPPPPPLPAAPEPAAPEPATPAPLPTLQASPEDTRSPAAPAAVTAGTAADTPPVPPAAARRRRRGRLATAGWTLGILLLLFALAVQFAYFMRDELARHAALRPWLTQLCAHTGCEIPLLRAPEQIRMVARDIRRHPTARDALRVSLTFANDADFAQSYPVIQLRFFDMRDRVLAQRRFTPQEYLPQNIDMAAGMPAHGALQTVMEIGDPGADAVNFTFDFL
jgi:hypothetical protein